MNIDRSTKSAQDALNLVKDITRGLVESGDNDAVVVFAACLKEFADGAFECTFEPQEREAAISVVKKCRLVKTKAPLDGWTR